MENDYEYKNACGIYKELIMKVVNFCLFPHANDLRLEKYKEVQIETRATLTLQEPINSSGDSTWKEKEVECKGSGPKFLARVNSIDDELENAVNRLDRIGGKFLGYDRGGRLVQSYSDVLKWRDMIKNITGLAEPADIKKAILKEMARQEKEKGLVLEPPTPQPGEGEGRATKETNTFRHEGDFWEIVYKGDPLPPIRDLDGFHYIHQTLYNLGKRFKALEIYRKVKEDTPIIEAGEDEEGLSISSALTSGQRQEVMDSMSREDVKKAIKGCKQKIAEAEEEGNIKAIKEWREKLQVLERQLSSGAGLPNRPRYFPDDNEKARKAVTKVIDKALQEIKKYNESLYAHLDKSITRGAEVYYHPIEPTTWE